MTLKTEEDDTTSTGGSDSPEGNTVTDETPSESVADAGSTVTDAAHGEVTGSDDYQAQAIETADEPTALEMALMRQRDGETLSADDQKILLQNKICPICGSEMMQHGTHLYCQKYDYQADGTFDAPVIIADYLHGVTPKHPLPYSQNQ